MVGKDGLWYYTDKNKVTVLILVLVEDGGKARVQRGARHEEHHVLILVLVEDGGKVLLDKEGGETRTVVLILVLVEDGGKDNDNVEYEMQEHVLILVLVEDGGKDRRIDEEKARLEQS